MKTKNHPENMRSTESFRLRRFRPEIVELRCKKSIFVLVKEQFLIPPILLVLLGGIDRSFAPVISGFLQVDIFPAEAVTAGAQWSVDGPLPVRDSGTYTVLAVGIHTVYFTTVSGWITPADQQATIVVGQTTTNYGTYVLSGSAPTLAVTLTPTNTALVSWPSPSTGWNLQQNTNLTTTNWVTPLESITDNGTNKFIIASPLAGNMFFRLMQ
jgi:hypothetical protein